MRILALVLVLFLAWAAVGEEKEILWYELAEVALGYPEDWRITTGDFENAMVSPGFYPGKMIFYAQRDLDIGQWIGALRAGDVEAAALAFPTWYGLWLVMEEEPVTLEYLEEITDQMAGSLEELGDEEIQYFLLDQGTVQNLDQNLTGAYLLYYEVLKESDFVLATVIVFWPLDERVVLFHGQASVEPDFDLIRFLATTVVRQ